MESSSIAIPSARLAAARVPSSWQSRVVRQEAGLFYVELKTYAELETLLAAIRADGIAIDELSIDETDLEQVFMKIMRDPDARVTP